MSAGRSSVFEPEGDTNVLKTLNVTKSFSANKNSSTSHVPHEGSGIVRLNQTLSQRSGRSEAKQFYNPACRSFGSWLRDVLEYWQEPLRSWPGMRPRAQRPPERMTARGQRSQDGLRSEETSLDEHTRRKSSVQNKIQICRWKPEHCPETLTAVYSALTPPN